MILLLWACADPTLAPLELYAGGLELCVRGQVQAEGPVLALDADPPEGLEPAAGFACEGGWTHSLTLDGSWAGWRSWDAEGVDDTPAPEIPDEASLSANAGFEIGGPEGALLTTDLSVLQTEPYGEPGVFEGCVVQELRPFGVEPGEDWLSAQGLMERRYYELLVVDHPRHRTASQPDCAVESSPLWKAAEPIPLVLRRGIAWAPPSE